MIKQIEVTVAVMLIISIFSGIEIYLNKRIENMKEGISKISSWKHLKIQIHYLILSNIYLYIYYISILGSNQLYLLLSKRKLFEIKPEK